MRVTVTGTPGVGKTTATELVGTDLEVVHLNDLVREEGLTTGTDEERDSLVVDLEAVSARLADRTDVLVESHLAHHVDSDRTIVLRCDPSELESRLLDRGETESKAAENAEAEALDVVLSEAVDRGASTRCTRSIRPGNRPRQSPRRSSPSSPATASRRPERSSSRGIYDAR